MIVFTGGVEYLKQFKSPSREGAYKLRAIFPALDKQLEIMQNRQTQKQQIETAQQGTKGDGYLNVDKQHYIAPISTYAETKLADKVGSIVILPNVTYRREEVNEILEVIPLAVSTKDEVDDYLKTIEAEVANLKRYQNKSHQERFYSEMQESLRRIIEANKKIYELTNIHKAALANSLRRLILEWIEPLRKELDKHIALSAKARDELEFKTKCLFAMQSFIARQSIFKDKLMEHLEQVRALFKKPGEPGPRCYISYAWPSEEHKSQEYWIQPFLYILYDHLKAAGINMVMDGKRSAAHT